jgi:prefoldin alpha subunit
MSLGGGGNQRLQELAQEIEALEEQMQALEAEIAGLQEQQLEIDEATDAVQELDSGATVQVPLGGGAYVRATIEEIDEIVVDLGGDFAAERDRDGAVESLEAKREIIDERIEELRSEIAEVETQSAELEEEAQQAQAQQMQQLQQQQQGQGRPDE